MGRFTDRPPSGSQVARGLGQAWRQSPDSTGGPRGGRPDDRRLGLGRFRSGSAPPAAVRAGRYRAGVRMLLPDQRPVDDDELADIYDWPESTAEPWVRGLMVVTLDGAFAGPDGLSGSISGPGDQDVFAASRALAHAYLVGATTIRAERYKAVHARPAVTALRAERGLQPAPTLAIVTATCRFDWANAGWVTSDERPVVLTTDRADPGLRAAAAKVGCDVVVAGGDQVDLGVALAELAARGLTRINCEGGPTLLGELIAADRLDKLALTVAPLVTHARIPHGPGAVVLTGFRLEALLEEDGFLFGRYVRDADVTAGAQRRLAADSGAAGHGTGTA